MTDLKQEVINGLKNRPLVEWNAIAIEADVSPSLIAQLARGRYKSSPIYSNLLSIAAAVKKFPRQKKAA